MSELTHVARWRPAVAGLSGVGAASLLVNEIGVTRAFIVATPILGLLAAAVVVWRARLGPQLFARAVWWSNLALGAMLTTSPGERREGFYLALGCGTALLVIGRKGLAEASERSSYLPASFRGSLLLLMILALADAQTFGLVSLVSFRNEEGSPIFDLFLTIGFVVGFIGLFRMRIWGALLNAALAVICLVGVCFCKAEERTEIARLFIALCALQLLAMTPLLIGVLIKRPLPSAPVWVRRVLPPCAVGVVMAFSCYEIVWHIYL